MHIQIGNQPYIYRPDGTPIEGRLSVLLRDSNNLAATYTLEGTTFVPAQNPVLLHAGLPDDSLFVDAGLYRLKVERWTGPEGEMSVDGDPLYFETVDIFEVGFEWDPAVSTAGSVGTIEDLASVSPDVSTVTVLGYSAVGDCPPRVYYWDSNSTDAIDGGYVVGSSVSDEGRWILLWGDEVLPASIYGVVPGDISNMSALLSYPRTVGSFALCTAPVVRFARGTYSTATNYVTEKGILADAGTRFVGGVITCSHMRVLGGALNTYVGDFIFSASDAEAHSSWFRTVEKFWTCGASVLHLDAINHFANNTISQRLTVPDKVILGTQRLDVNYANDGYVYLTRCSVDGRIFNPQKDYVRLSSSDRGDSIFTDAGTWDPGLISQGHHVQYDDVPDLAQFRSVERWYQAINERKARLGQQMSMTALNFDGRACPVNIDTSVWGAVKNVQANGGITVKNTVLLDNVRGDIDVNAEIAAGVTLQDCSVRITGTPVNFSSLTAIDSTVTVPGSIGLDPANTMITMYGGHFNGIIALSAAHAQSFAASKSVDFRNVSFETAFTWKVNRLNMQGCTGPISIDLYPVNTAGNYLYSINLDKNVFTGSSRVWFGLPRGLVSYSALDGKGAFGSVRIVDNSFETSDPLGIKMLRWNPGTLNRFVAQEPGAWEYHGNSGNCPRLSPGAVYNGDSHWVQYAQGGTQWCKYASPLNLFAPYAYYSDGSINYARDNTGLSPDRSSGQMCMCCTTANAAPLVLLCGYCAGQTLPSDGWDEDANDLFVLIPAITNGTGSMPAPTTGFTYWYQQGLV